MKIFTVYTVFIHTTQKKNSKSMNKYVMIMTYVEIPNENNKVLKCTHGEKFMRVSFIVYADLECLLEKNAFVSK